MRLAGFVATLWLVAFLLTTSCDSARAASYSFYIANGPGTAQAPTVQLQPGTAGSSTVSYGVYATVTVNSSRLPLYYIPVTLTNSQTSATPNPFQALVQPNPSLYSAYEASDLGNIRFCSDTACNSPLYSWLEGCGSSAPYGACSTSSTSAAFWVKLTSPIAGRGGTLTIYMVFLSTSAEFDGVQAGEAPNLSGTYAQFDNGANVFTFYDNFAGTSLSAKWSEVNSSGGSVTVNNGATFTTATGSDWIFLYSATQAYPQVAEAYMVSVAGDNPMIGVETLSGYNTYYAMYNGYSLDWWSGTEELCAQVSSGEVDRTTLSIANFPAGVWSVYWAATGREGSKDGAGNTMTWTDNDVGAIANYGIYVGVSNIGVGSNVVRWARMRAYPPSNVMPSDSFGSVSAEAILTFTNSSSTSWLANLVVVSSSNAARLINLTISFYSPYSQQVILGTGVTNQNSGPQVTLGASATILIVMGVTVSSTGTTTVTMGLKVQSLPVGGATSAYCYDIISLGVS